MSNESMDNAENQAERRKSERIDACFTVTYKLSRHVSIEMLISGREVSAIMIDLSQEGMAILMEASIPTLTVLSISFTLINELSSEIRPMQMEGEVRYNTLLKERAYRVGIAFTKIADCDKVAITDFINMTKEWDSSHPYPDY